MIGAFEHDPSRPQGPSLHETDVRRVERALDREDLLAPQFASDVYPGTATRKAYAKWHQRSGIGGPYDGLPGIHSLTLLGHKHGFRVLT
jgi:hypothetical protein